MRRTILGAVLVLAVSTAHADDKKKAKTLYDEGLNHYNLAEYTEAIKSWKESYRLSKKPLLLFNIGQAYRLSGDCKQAMIFYDSYQREEPSPKNQDELDEALKLCKDGGKPADKPVTPVTPPVTPTVTTGTTKPGDKPVTPPVTPAKPADKPAVLVPDKPADKPAVGQVASPPEEPEEPEEPTTSGGGLRKIGIGVGAAGVVVAGVGVYFAMDSRKAGNELDGYEGEWGQEEIDLEKRGQRSATLGWILGLGGVAVAAAGGVMIAIGGPKTVETSSVTVVPTKGGAALGWSFRF